MITTHYCLGFAFGYEFTGKKSVLLIRKRKPEWMAGMVNGIGGKVEAGESIYAAMVREFREECGIETEEAEWLKFATLNFPETQVHCFTTVIPLEKFRTWATKTEEEVVQTPVGNVWSLMPMRNLAWLIPMAEAACADSSEFPLEIT